MPASEPLYNVRDRTGNPEYELVDDVIELVVGRAKTPRDDHEDAHFDTAMATIIDTYGTEPVHTVIHRVFIDNEPFRTATNGLELGNVGGVRIGTAASWFLEELNVQDDG